MGTCVRSLLERSTEPNTRHAFGMGTCRRWSSPENILVVSDSLDEQSIQFHAIQQARQSGAKVLLIQVERRNSNAIARTHHLHGALSLTGSIHASRDPAERMAGNLRSSGIDCEPIVVRSIQAREISRIASTCRADRVLVKWPPRSERHRSMRDYRSG